MRAAEAGGEGEVSVTCNLLEKVMLQVVGWDKDWSSLPHLQYHLLMAQLAVISSMDESSDELRHFLDPVSFHGRKDLGRISDLNHRRWTYICQKIVWHDVVAEGSGGPSRVSMNFEKCRSYLLSTYCMLGTLLHALYVSHNIYQAPTVYCFSAVSSL